MFFDYFRIFQKNEIYEEACEPIPGIPDGFWSAFEPLGVVNRRRCGRVTRAAWCLCQLCPPGRTAVTAISFLLAAQPPQLFWSMGMKNSYNLGIFVFLRMKIISNFRGKNRGKKFYNFFGEFAC